MSVTAPPRPPRPGDPVDRDELEALVEASMPIIVSMAERVAEILVLNGYPEDEAIIKGERVAAVYADLLAERQHT